MKVTIELNDRIVEMLEKFRVKRINLFEEIAEEAMKKFGQKSYDSWIFRMEEYRDMDHGDLVVEYLDFLAFEEDERNG